MVVTKAWELGGKESIVYEYRILDLHNENILEICCAKNMYTFNIVSTLFLEFSLIPGTWSMLSCMGAKLLQSCSILCDPVDHSLSGSSVHGIFQSRILEWVSMYSSKGSSQPGN